jgi:lia operon protein LiaG
MKTSTWVGGVGAVALASALASAARAQETHAVPGQDVAIYNLAGQVQVERGTGSDVVVRVTRGGADAPKLRIETGNVDGRSTLRIVYPDDRIVYPGMGRRSSTTVRVRDDGTFNDDRGSGGRRVQIHGSGSGIEAWADLVIQVPDGKALSVYVATGASVARGVNADLRFDSGSGSVDASDIKGSLNVDTGSGGVTVRGVQGSLRVDTGSGSVGVRDVSGDKVVIETGSGGVHGGGLTSSSVSIDTGSGSIELDGVKAPDVVLDTGSGSVDVALLSDVDRLDVDTGSGGVTIHAPANLGAEVELETGSGSFDLDFPVQTRSVRRDYLKGTIGDGKGRIHIDTGSGGISILRGTE